MSSKFQLGTGRDRLAHWGKVHANSLPNESEGGLMYDHRSFPVLRLSPVTGEREIAWMREGLIPSYAHDAAGADARSEAPAESLTSSASFRCAFRRRRCIVPADVFNECQHAGSGLRVSCSFSPDAGGIFGIASVWENWCNDAGHQVQSFAIITRHVAAPLQAIFDRLPIIIADDQQDHWLARSGGDDLPFDLLRTLTREQLRSWKLTPCDELLSAAPARTPGVGQTLSPAF